MKKELLDLRNEMDKKGVDAYLFVNSDAHSSEYLSDYDKQIKFISGFTGSAAILLVTKDEAKLWTDGRYFIQASKELENSGIELMKMGEKGVLTLKEYLKKNLKKGEVLGFNSSLFNIKTVLDIKKELEEIEFYFDTDIIESIWKDRPARSCNKVFLLPESYTGEASKSKISRVREKIKEKKANSYISTNLSDIAWLTNLRGSDIECNPQFLSYIYISSTRAILFANTEVFTKEALEYLKNSNIELKSYEEYYKFIDTILDEIIILDDTECNYRTYLSLVSKNKLKYDISIITMFKIRKNEIEIANTKEAHIRDAVYEVKFIKWLKEKIALGEKISEIDASNYLDDLRAGDEKFLSLSFDTISAYAANAAMPHYKATESSFAYLQNKGLYLVDSGATYLDGTTDVTRTFALGEVSEEVKKHYTLALVGMLRLMNAKFPRGIDGQNLDTLARYALWEYGIDFNHGTGHGVGFCNGVHEGPISIRKSANPDPRKNIGLDTGMILSDEPGVYVEGSHGIRCENLLVVVKESEDFLKFETLTLIPFDTSIIAREYMTKRDIVYLNEYQNLVYESLKDRLDVETRKWLYNETREISLCKHIN